LELIIRRLQCSSTGLYPSFKLFVDLLQGYLSLFAHRDIPRYHQYSRTPSVIDDAGFDLHAHPPPISSEGSEFMLVRHSLASQASLGILPRPLTVFRGNGFKEILGGLIRYRAKEFGMGWIPIDRLAILDNENSVVGFLHQAPKHALGLLA